MRKVRLLSPDDSAGDDHVDTLMRCCKNADGRLSEVNARSDGRELATKCAETKRSVASESKIGFARSLRCVRSRCGSELRTVGGPDDARKPNLEVTVAVGG